MDKRVAQKATDTHKTDDQLREAGRKVLHCFLSLALATSLMPVGATRALADELTAQGEPAQEAVGSETASDENEIAVEGEAEAEPEASDEPSAGNETQDQSEDTSDGSEPAAQDEPSTDGSDEGAADTTADAASDAAADEGTDDTGEDGSSKESETVVTAIKTVREKLASSVKKLKMASPSSGSVNVTFTPNVDNEHDGAVYHNDDVTVAVTVVAGSGELAETDAAKVVDGSSETNLAWDGTSKTFSGNVTVKSEGEHSLSVQVIDDDTNAYAEVATKTVVIDKTAPAVEVWDGTDGLDCYKDTISGNKETRLFDLTDDAKVAFGAKTTDTDIKSGTLTYTLVDADGNAFDNNNDGEDDNKVEKGFAASGSAQVAATDKYQASDLVASDGSPLYVKASIEVEDYAGNKTTSVEIVDADDNNTKKDVTTFVLGSETAQLEKMAAAAETGLAVTAAEGTSGPQDVNGVATYNGSVTVSLDLSTASWPQIAAVKLTGEAETSAGFALDSGSATGSKTLSTKGVHTLTTTVTTAGGAKRTLTKQVGIAPASPALAGATLANAADATKVTTDESTVYYYKNDDDGNLVAPTIAVELTDADGVANVNASGALVATATAADGSTVALEGTWSNTGDTYTLMPTNASSLTQNTKYTVAVAAKDAFGTTVTSNATEAFVIDATAPVIKVSFSGPAVTLPGGLVGFWKYWNKDGDYSAFEEGVVGALTITVTDAEVDTSTLKVAGSLDGAPASTAWTEVDGGYRVQIPYAQTDEGVVFAGEGNDRTLTVSCADVAGNTASYEYAATDEQTTLPEGITGASGDTFVVDTTPVEYKGVTTSVTGEEKVAADGKSYTVYNTSALTLSLTLKDANLDKDQTTVAVNGTNVDKITWDDTNASSGTYVAQVTLTEPTTQAEDGKVVPLEVTLSANDLLGNKTTKETVGTYVLDSTAPQVSVSYSPDVPEVVDGLDYYLKRLTATITVVDPFFDGTSVADAVEADGTIAKGPSEWVQSKDDEDNTLGKFTTEVTFGNTAYGKTDNLKVIVSDLLKHETTHVYKDDSYVKDGVTVAHSETFIVDNTPPVVAGVSFSPALVGTYENVDYFDAKTTATITVQDNNFDADAANSKVEATNGTWCGSWKDNSNGTYTTTVEYDTTPVGKTAGFTIKTVDVVGNKTTDKTTYADWGSGKEADDPKATTFVVDTDEPQVAVNLSQDPSNKNDATDYYAASELTATVTVTDNNFDDLKSSVTAEHGQVGAWEQQRDAEENLTNQWVAEITFAENNADEYNTLSVKFQDKLQSAVQATKGNEDDVDGHNGSWSYATGARTYGNETEAKAARGATQFVLDNTPPAIAFAFTGPGANLTDDGNIAGFFNKRATQADSDNIGYMTMTVKDRNIDEGGLEVSGSGSLSLQDKGDKNKWVRTSEGDGSEKVYVYTLTVPYYSDGANFYYIRESDTDADLKSLSLTAIDLAGNDENHDYKGEDSGVNGVKKDGTKFTVDISSPKIDKRVDQNVDGVTKKQYETTLGNTTAMVDVYQMSELTVRVPVKDVHLSTKASYVKLTEYRTAVNSETKTTSKTFTKDDWKQENKAENPNDWYLDVPLTDDGTTDNVVYRIDVYAMDRLGNAPSTEELYGGTFIAVDNTKPVVQLSMTSNGTDAIDVAQNVDANGQFVYTPADQLLHASDAESSVDYYQWDNVQLVAKVFDASFGFGKEANGTVVRPAGQRVDAVVNDGKIERYKTVGGDSWIWNADERCWQVALPYGQNNYQVAYDFAVTASDLLNNEKKYAYGDADEGGKGNQTTANGTPVAGTCFRVDKKKPQVDVQLDQTWAGAYEDVDYYATKSDEGSLTATITVTDTNFDPKSAFEALSDAGYDSESVSWLDWDDGENVSTNHKWKQLDTSKPEYTARVAFSETAVDKVAAFKSVADRHVVDYAINRTEYAYGANEGKCTTVDAQGKTVSNDRLVLDTTDPVLAVQFDHAPQGKVDKTDTDYYDTTYVKATITVKDRNFDGRMKVSTIGDAGKLGEVTDWVQSEDDPETWTAYVEWKAEHEVDQHSKLDIAYQDKVATAAQASKVDLSAIKGATTHVGTWDYATGARKGQTTTGAEWFVLDHTRPTVKVYVSKARQDGFKYQGNELDFYADEPTITLVVQDNNFDPDSSLNLQANAPAAHGEDAGTWTQSKDDHTTWKRKVTYGETAGIEDWFDLSANIFDLVYTAAPKADGADGHRTPYAYRQSNDKDKDVETYIKKELAEGSAKGFVVDKTPPEMESVTIARDPSNEGNDIQFYNKDARLEFVFTDACGLETVALTDDADGTYVIEEGTTGFSRGDTRNGKPVRVALVERKEASRKPSLYERDVELKVTDIAGNYRIWTISSKGVVKKVIAGQEKASKNIPINGTEGNHPKGLLLDKTAPQVSLADHALAGTYSNETKSVTCSVVEANFDYLQENRGDEEVMFVTKQEGNAGRAESSFAVPASTFKGSAANWSHTESFADDGHYTVYAQFSDYANNKSNRDEIGEFTIDKTAPVMTVDWDNTDVRNGKYYKATRTATITVVEHNFDPSLFTIETTGSIGGWSDNGDTHVCTVSFGEGSAHTFKVNGEDKAGNPAQEITEPEFVVDLTAPEVTIAGTAQRLGYQSADSSKLVNAYHDVLEDKSAYNGVVLPTITYTDNESLSAADLTYTVTGSKHGEDVSYNATDPGDGTEVTVQFSDFGYTGEGAADGSNWQDFYVDDYAVDADDIYTITASLTDQAGNEANAELTFSVNRYGSNYAIAMDGVNDDELTEYKNSGMLSEAPTIVVREVSVSGVGEADDHQVEKEFANATTLLERKGGNGAGYRLDTLKPEDATNGWSEYVYTIRSANFGEGSDSDNNDRGQGIYRVNVMSDDLSSNANTTAEYWESDSKRAKAEAKGATTEFILDELAPVIDEVKLPEHLSAGEEFEASFHVTDDITSGNTVEVVVDGQKLDDSEVSGPESGVGTFTFKIPAKSFDWSRKVQILVRDYAGREATVANDGWFWQSRFLAEGGCVAAAVAAVAGGVAFWRRKRRLAEPELPTR